MLPYQFWSYYLWQLKNVRFIFCFNFSQSSYLQFLFRNKISYRPCAKYTIFNDLHYLEVIKKKTNVNWRYLFFRWNTRYSLFTLLNVVIAEVSDYILISSCITLLSISYGSYWVIVWSLWLQCSCGDIESFLMFLCRYFKMNYNNCKVINNFADTLRIGTRLVGDKRVK